MLTGTEVGRGTASSADYSNSATYIMIIPAKTTANIAEMAREGLAWQRQAEDLRRTTPGRVAERAQFAEETLAIATDNLRLGIPTTIVAQASDSRILGAILFDVFTKGDKKGQGVLKLLAIEPKQLAGTPGNRQLRGIGTALTAAASRQLLAKGVQVIYIHPLDEEARRFWLGRGAELCGEVDLLCVRGVNKVNALINGCQLRPCDPGSGECLLCGSARFTEQMRLPGVR